MRDADARGCHSVEPAEGPAEGTAAAATHGELDLRALPAPQPLERALAAADALSPGAELVLLTPLLPLPLLDLLDARGFEATATLRVDGSARVVVRHR